VARAFVQIRDRILLSAISPSISRIAGIRLRSRPLVRMQQDDLIHSTISWATLIRREIVAPLDMFKFLDGDSAHNRMMNLGVLPWWTDRTSGSHSGVRSRLDALLDYRYGRRALCSCTRRVYCVRGLIAVMHCCTGD